MDRIVLDESVAIGKEVGSKGLLWRPFVSGGRIGNILTVTDSGGKDFRGGSFPFG
jgi:hypothetical protein